MFAWVLHHFLMWNAYDNGRNETQYKYHLFLQVKKIKWAYEFNFEW